MAPGFFYGAFLGAPHPVLDLGKGLLDRIEIRGVWRQEPEPRAGSVDDLADSGRLVTAEVVRDDDVAGLENRHELLGDIGAEALALIGPSKTQGAVSWSQRSAPRKVSVR